MNLLAMTLALGAVALAPQTIELAPSEDVWVYPHASDPSKDEYLRVWGLDGRAVATDPSEIDSISYSYLQWRLDGVPKDKRLVEAKLTLTSVADPSYSFEAAKASPIEVRPLSSVFTEKAWTHESARRIAPDPKIVFGAGAPEAPWTAGKTFTIVVDLLKGPGDFGAALRAGLAGTGDLAMALTSKIDASERAVYKLYSRNGPEASRPRLRLVFE